MPDASRSAICDPTELSNNMIDVAERSRRIAGSFLERLEKSGDGVDLDPLGLTETFMRAMGQMEMDPVAMTEVQLQFWQDSISLWHHTGTRLLGLDADPVVHPDPGDRRFRDDAWQDNSLFNFIKQSYLLAARYILSGTETTNGLDEKTAHKVNFFTRQFVDALSPTNFIATNPEVLRETLQTKGQNLVSGLQNMLEDLERGKGRLQVKMTDQEAFELGVNVATTPGKVVFQTDLMQLLQYEPTTRQVFKRPLLIMPPWINKYYIMDLRPKNSLIKWLVGQGHTVFVISWVNPDESHAETEFEDYLLKGPLAALDAIEQATGERDVNAIGYCLGGTLLAVLLAYLNAKQDRRVKSATFLTTLVDFSEPGDLGVFIDEQQVSSLEKQMQEKGYLDGASMAGTFNMLRANDLVWSFVINNYYMGRDPLAFDLLYWNSDSTRMPARMHSFYLREMYMQNRLVEPGGITLDGVPIDVGQINTPSYFLSTREDHIAPWTATYLGARLFTGPVRFVLAGSGHIAGVVNPPSADKYGFWVNTRKPATVQDPERWLATATEKAGSWWPDWARWAARRAGKKVPARIPGDHQLEVVEDAPGAYARVRANATDKAPA